jgi:Ca2+-binding EF-hand superfamily protein
MSGPAVDLKSLPNLPGFHLPEYKERYPKQNSWNIVGGHRIEVKEGLSHEKPKFVKAARQPETWRNGSLPESTTRAVFKGTGLLSEHSELPAWDALDRHVLRFQGYFKEAVVETNLENYRVRHVTILYYLEDDTCHVSEPKQDNSGIPQGQLIRRHRFPAKDGGYLKPTDLEIGSEMVIYGRSILVTDCDPFTRMYFEQLGKPQPDPIEAETDPFSQTREALKVKSAGQPRTYEKIYREVMLGGGHVNADMQQFLENDKKVLRFYAVMDDVCTPTFERRPFIICFYLADDQVEIREQYPLNCGRDNFPIFFTKGKMPIGAYTVDGPQAQPRKKSEYVHGHDFAVGMNVTLLGNYHFYVYDADPFTRMYFEEELGVKLEDKISVQLPERTVPRAATPPYTGYGSWDDSMGSVTHLVPKMPQKDFKKLFQHSGKILRFKAKFSEPKPEDVDRVFVISFYLEDDCLAIHEPPQRNLGIVTGRFLEKGIHMNQITGALFAQNDLTPGNVVKVYNTEFLIMDCDEYTKKMLEDPNQKRKKFDLESVVQKIRESLRQQYPLVRDIFRRFDYDHDGVLKLSDFKRVLEKHGFVLEDEHVGQIMEHFDTRGDGQVSYNEFCDALLDEDYHAEMLKVKPPMSGEFNEDYQARAQYKMVERKETAEVRRAVRQIGDILHKRQNMIVKVFKELGHITHESTVTCEQIQQALLSCGSSVDLEDVVRTVLFVLPGAPLDKVPYVEFTKAMTANFHDTYATR